MYATRISRERPTSFLFLIDQSQSMNDPFGGAVNVRKSEALADALNRLLWGLVQAATKADVRHYFDIAVIGYGNSTFPGRIGPVLHGSTVSDPFVPIQEIADNPKTTVTRIKKHPDGAGGLVEVPIKLPIWVEPVNDNGTPMAAAFEYILPLVEDAAQMYSESFPPTVIHITDGESTDRDPTAAAARIPQISTKDGNALVFNIHVSSSQGQAFLLDSDVSLTNDLSRMLFHMSSILPPVSRELGRHEGFPVTDRTRGFAFNADATQLIQFLQIGTATGMAERLLLPGGQQLR
jgi:hypothetical protein